MPADRKGTDGPWQGPAVKRSGDLGLLLGQRDRCNLNLPHRFASPATCALPAPLGVAVRRTRAGPREQVVKGAAPAGHRVVLVAPAPDWLEQRSVAEQDAPDLGQCGSNGTVLPLVTAGLDCRRLPIEASIRFRQVAGRVAGRASRTPLIQLFPIAPAGHSSGFPGNWPGARPSYRHRTRRPSFQCLPPRAAAAPKTYPEPCGPGA